MNWFRLAKFGQIWNVEYHTDSLEACLSALYQLTYKYQQLQIHKFKGHPKRHENILLGIEQRARQVIQDTINILEPAFSKWLAQHAITNPVAWGTNHIDQQFEMAEGSPDALGTMFNNFTLWPGENRKIVIPPDAVAEHLDAPLRNGQMPYLAQWFKAVKAEMAEGDKENQGELDTRPEEQIDEYYEQLDFSDYFAEFYENNWVYMMEQIAQHQDIYEVAKEIASYGLFPEWFGYWRSVGIEQTRENVEQAYALIHQLKSQPIDKALANINIIINTCHQNGDMLEYITEETSESVSHLKEVMSYYSNLSDSSPEMKDWNKQLRGVGTKFPVVRRPKQPTEPIVPQQEATPQNPNEAL